MTAEKPTPLQEHELVDFWYAILNHTDPKESKVAFALLSSLLEEDGFSIEDVIRQSEKPEIDPMIRSMCYDSLKRTGRQVSDEQKLFLKSNPWQNKFWG